MRHLPALSVLLVCASAALAGAAPGPAPSGSILLHLHPRAWHPPASLVRPGLRTEVEPAGDGTPTAAELAAIRAARASALANVHIQTRPDGSGYAVLGGLIRAYAIARIGPDGRL